MKPVIAIVGMACRYPDSRSPAELWENALAGRRAFRRLPAERLRLADYDEATGPDSIYLKEAALLTDWEFDRVAFRVAGPSFRAADLAHWLALETAAAALADAGFPAAEGLDRSTTGVIVGNSLTGEFSRAGLMRLRWPYVARTLGAELAAEGIVGDQAAELLARLEARYKAPFPPPGEETLAGGLANTIAGRICNHFDLNGGGYTVDGACSSSLLAVTNGCSALAAGDLDFVVAGGVDLSLDPFELVGFSRAGAFARDRMRVFDARSAGFLPGEGSGFVVLMRAEDALASGQRIHALIPGWGISSDGAGGLTRPEPEGQRLALERAYRRAGFGADEVALFEGHGTGTTVGDAVELTAVVRARRAANPAAPPAAIGSVKAIIGHTKAAAGVAGLIKATLAVKAAVLPPTVGCDEPHPVIRDTTEGPAMLRVLRHAEPWPAGVPVKAAVSAMGFGGINSHVVIEGAERRARRSRLGTAERRLAASRQDAELLVLAAADRAALALRASELAAEIAGLSHAELGDLASHLAAAPRGGGARAAVVAATPGEAATRLTRLAALLQQDGGPAEAVLQPDEGIFLGAANRLGKAPRVGFLFPGQASPGHLGGGAWVRRFEEVEELYRTAGLPGEGDDVATEIAQPAITTATLAGLAVLGRLGVEATVAVGHSLGELAALHWAGVYDAEALLRVATARGRAMAGLPPRGGAMLGLSCSGAEAEDLLSGVPGAIGVAGYNAPRQTVVSGDTEAILAVVARAAERGVATVKLKVSHAFHSPLVADAGPVLAAALSRETLESPRALGRTVLSTITGAALEGDTDVPALLARQLTSPVRFHQALGRAQTEAGVDLWLEVGPGRVLTGLGEKCGAGPVIALDAGGESLVGLLSALAAAHVLGAPVELAELFRDRFTRPYQRERRFLANPCEDAPLPAEGGGFMRRPVMVPVVPVVAASEAVATPAGAPAAPVSALDLVRQLVAERAELPAETVLESSRMLTDLHLNSIAVGQLVVEAARRLGAPPPASPTDFADAAVADVARALESLAQAAAQAGNDGVAVDEGPPAGVDSWTRPFQFRWYPQPLAERVVFPGALRLWAPDGDPLAASLEAGLATLEAGGGAGGHLVLVPTALDGAALDNLLASAKAALAERESRWVLVTRGGGGAGFARSFHLERGHGSTVVVDLGAAEFDAESLPLVARWVQAEARRAHAPGGYTEVRYDAHGTRHTRRLELVPAAHTSPELPLGPMDVVLVSGGGRGIGVECALALARATGARLAILGRSRPEENGELAANLERLAAAGVTAHYAAADVTDAAATRAAVAQLTAALGPVTALLHSAGVNHPQLVAGLDRAAMERTLAPKLRGLENLLAALDPASLRLLVAFGSIIGAAGLPGEADYALANECLALAVEAHGAAHPHTRTLTAEWSVWSGTGMGERLGTLEGLLRQGITPIPLDRGVEMLLELLGRTDLPPSVVVAGRFGTPSTVEVAGTELPFLRFLERSRVHVPGVELVVEADLSADTDPYLADHVFAGERLFPAVLGLEAMAQAAAAVVGRAGEQAIPVFEAVGFARPVSVPEGRTITLRLAALARSAESVEVVLRSSGTMFQVDHFRAVCRFPRVPALAGETLREMADARIDLDPQRQLYGGVMFHQGRFRRLKAYQRLSATDCLADISPDGHTTWFGRYLPGSLLLGDPAARDATIHAVQACIPHATVLPVAVERLTAGLLDVRQAHRVEARERYREGRKLVYDLEVTTADGRLVERWEGLELRAVDDRPVPTEWPLPLLAPHLERRLADLVPGVRVAVVLEPGSSNGTGGRRAASNHAMSLALGRAGSAAQVFRRADGKPEAHGAAGLNGTAPAVSVSHAAGLVLAVAGAGPLGCDAEPVVARSVAEWQGLLGDRWPLAELLTRELGEPLDQAATRVWSAVESLKKGGLPVDAPLVLERAAGDRWVVLRAGSHALATVTARVAGLAEPAVLSLLVATPQAPLS